MITAAMHGRMAGDATLVALVNTYGGEPAIFTTDPAPGDAVLPYIVTAGDITVTAWDTKTTRGRQITRDVRCYTAASGDADVSEAMAERVRYLFHRRPLEIDGFVWIMAECSGPQVADEQDAYGRIVTCLFTVEEV